MSAFVAVVPWALFGIMVLFGMIFSIVAWRATRKAADQEDRADQLAAELAQMTARAQSAEARIQQAENRANLAEVQIGQFADSEARAREQALEKEREAARAKAEAEGAFAAAARADSELQERRDAAADKARRAEQRAKSLMEWARSQWESRRETDRQRAQAQQGSFQAQLEIFLESRRAPVMFRTETEVDRLAANDFARYAGSGTVQVQGDEVRVSYPVDPAQGFRA